MSTIGFFPIDHMKNIYTTISFTLACLLLLFAFRATPLCAAPKRGSQMQTPSLHLTDAEREYLNGKKQLTMVCDPQWPPYEQITADGRYVGVGADYMDALSKRVGIPFQMIKTKDWSESVHIFQKNECDLVTMLNKTPERSRYLNFTEPYFITPLVIVSTEMLPTERLDDLKDKPLAVVKGYKVEEDLRRDFPDIPKLRVGTTEESIRVVKNGKAAATIVSQIEASHFIRVLKYTNLKATGQTRYANMLRVGVRKNDPLLLSIMNKAVASLSESDKRMIEQTWITEEALKPQSDSHLWLTLGVCVVAIIGAGFWVSRWYSRIHS